MEETNYPLDSLLEHLAANFTSVKELEEILLVIHHRLDFGVQLNAHDYGRAEC